jgi:hypothetical protein
MLFMLHTGHRADGVDDRTAAKWFDCPEYGHADYSASDQLGQ